MCSKKGKLKAEGGHSDGGGGVGVGDDEDDDSWNTKRENRRE